MIGLPPKPKFTKDEITNAALTVARGKGIGQKMLDFARKKLEEYEHPRLSVLDTNARAIALYRRMGWKFTGEKDMEFDPAEYPSVVKKCALLWMQYEG